MNIDIPEIFRCCANVALAAGWQRADPIGIWMAVRRIDLGVDEDGTIERQLQAYWKEHASEYPWAYHE